MKEFLSWVVLTFFILGILFFLSLIIEKSQRSEK